MQLGLELDGLILYDCPTYVGTVLMRKSVSLAFAIGLAAAGIGQAEPISVSSKSQSGLSKAQLKVLDTRAASQYANSVRLQPPRAIVPGTPAALAAAGKYDGPYLIVARKAAAHHQIPEDLFLRLVRQESGWNQNARSEKGAIGLAQLMPGRPNSCVLIRQTLNRTFMAVRSTCARCLTSSAPGGWLWRPTMQARGGDKISRHSAL